MSNLPQQITNHYGRVYPDAWRQAEEFLLAKGKDLKDWHDWCYLPLAASFAIVDAEAAKHNVPIQKAAADIGNLGAILAWRMTKGIYKFDNELLEALWTTPLDGDLPVELFYRLPEWCCFLDVQKNGMGGCFVYLEEDTNTGHSELRFSFVSNDGPLISFPLHLKKDGVISGIQSAIEFSIKNVAGMPGLSELISDVSNDESVAKQAEFISPYVSLVLYLCSVNADIFNPRQAPHNPAPKKTKKGLRYFEKKKQTEYRVGSILGGAIRRYRAQESLNESTRHSKTPHIRRAHFHTFRTGTGRTNTLVKWLPPIPVNVLEDELVPTLRRVN